MPFGKGKMQVRAICVQIANHGKLEVSSLSGDFKNAHRSPAKIQKDPYDSKGYTHTPYRNSTIYNPAKEVRVQVLQHPGCIHMIPAQQPFQLAHGTSRIRTHQHVVASTPQTW